MEVVLLYVRGIYQAVAELVLSFLGPHCKNCMVLSNIERDLSAFCPIDRCKLEMSQFFQPPSSYLDF